jgi:hypothetical protein
MTSVNNCPECQGQLQVPGEFLGRKVKCPTCGAQFIAGGGSASVPVAPATPAPRSKPYDEDDEDVEYDDRPRRRRRSHHEPHRGSTILVLGILSIVVCTPLSIFAWVMGNTDLRKIREGTMDPEGEGLTQAGRICGMVGTGLMVMQCIFIAFYMVMLAALVGGGGGGGRGPFR